ncbi:hypothetical protein H6F88_31150 [Oculatella sp. FACHB-28]|uniref:hypothetical protein n=1 Tax=Oculatella sp. FACHB-28 TaxID=2692845 RepID=UPI0016887EB1|nr:hypothetical protein [Oculatella sp. FACHB-28]MBD1867537.1 hypothetical protein [Cyanobacteria bacterium FACHB-471]MBD2060403.1 hypothetical protein [Oculatella sp. FACHB-28]
MKIPVRFAVSLSLLVPVLTVPLMSNANPASSLENLPTGEYYYEAIHASETSSRSILFRKAGRTVIGVQMGANRSCFRGFAEGNRIVNATRVFPPYDPASRQDFQEEMLDLSQYSPVERAGRDRDRATLRTCIQFFWR